MSVGIIAEYNPFHNGHAYQLSKARELFPNEDIIVILSGKYVQRGEIAVASFEERKEMALKHGASKVVELPFEYATQAAHIFAEGAVKTAFENGVTKLFFGSESNDSKRLMLIAKTINDNESKYDLVIKEHMKQGYAFPKAASLALTALIGSPITLPNDILGLEYCKAIIKNNYPIEVFTLKRTVDFHSEVPNQEYASASYIREQLFKGKDVSKYTPMKLSKDVEKIQDHYEDFQRIVFDTPSEELAKIHLVEEGIENLFKKNIHISSYEEFVTACTSRRYTSSRIKRTILYILLGIKK